MEAGIPNVKGFAGGFGFDHTMDYGCSGSLTLNKSSITTSDGHTGLSYVHTWMDLNLDLSKVNSIYGNSDTVTPPSQSTLICIKH